jgi:solute carrier family 25 phosphate transporter 23/24/25/41
MCDTARDGLIDYQEFRAYVLEKEKDLWSLFADINKSGDNRLHPNELENALKSAGIRVTKDDIEAFMHVIDTGKLVMIGLTVCVVVLLLFMGLLIQLTFLCL